MGVGWLLVSGAHFGVACCPWQLFSELHMMTNEFAKLDTSRRGVIDVDYSTFVGMVMASHH